MPLEALESPTGLFAVRGDVRQGLAVFALEVAHELAPLSHRVEPFRVVDDAFGRESELALDVGDLGLHRAQARVEVGERRASVERRHRRAQRVRRRSFERVVRAAERLAVRGCVREQELLGFERDVFTGVADIGTGDLVDLEPEEVDLACTLAAIAPERGKIGVDAPQLGTRVAVRGERRLRVRAREAVERGTLHRGVEQRLVRVLAVQVHEPGAELRELGRGGETAVDIRATPPVAGHDAGDHAFLAGVGIHEPTLDPRLLRAVAHERRVGAAADEELERLHDQRLARAGLAGDGGQTGAE